MAEVLTVEDISSIYKGTVVLYKNKPVLVEAVGRNRDVSILDLFSQRMRVVPFDLELFANPTRRIGMLNIANSVLYGSRIPVRKYKAGLSSENVEWKHLPVEYPNSKMRTLALAQALNSPTLADCLFNRYPTISECQENAAAFDGCYAFDKQFAIDHRSNIIYKTKVVGKAPPKCQDPAQIIFKAEQQHLSILLGNNHEKTVRNSWS